MNITDEDRWMICAPVRTGGRFVTNLISEIYCNNDIMMSPIDGNSSGRADTVNPGEVLHTHYVEDYRKFKTLDNIKTVILTRNTIDSVLSLIIASHIGKYHIFSHSEMANTKPTKFHIDTAMLSENFRNVRRFYAAAQPDLTRDTIILDYKEILRGPQRTAELLGLDGWLNKEKLSKITQNLPIKNKWNNFDWISNQDEVMNTLATLDNRILEH